MLIDVEMHYGFIEFGCIILPAHWSERYVEVIIIAIWGNENTPWKILDANCFFLTSSRIFGGPYL